MTILPESDPLAPHGRLIWRLSFADHRSATVDAHRGVVLSHGDGTVQ